MQTLEQLLYTKEGPFRDPGLPAATRYSRNALSRLPLFANPKHIYIGESSILVKNLLVTQPLSRKIPITIFSFSNLLVQLHVDSVIMHALMLFPSIVAYQKSVTCFLAQVVEQMGLRN